MNFADAWAKNHHPAEISLACQVRAVDHGQSAKEIFKGANRLILTVSSARFR
jgi:hypothetical protein